MRPPRHLKTTRLRLRPPRLDDAQAIFEEYARDPEVTRYLMWSPHESVATTKEFLKRCLQVWKDESAFPWILIGKGDGRLMGMLEITVADYKVELGYVLSRRYWGRGYMAEAVRAVVDWALAQDGIFRVWAVCSVENPASARVLEKAGMREEGILRKWAVFPNLSPDPQDVRCFSIVKG